MRVTYVLAHPTLGGGTKVIAQHAALLREAGVDVTLVAQGPRPAWLPFRGSYVDTSGDAGAGAAAASHLATQDLVIATYWTTLDIATRLAIGPVAHFCQGYEGGLDYLRAEWPRIEAAYARRVPTLTVTPALGEMLARRFGRAWREAVPPIDPLFHPRRVPFARSLLRPRRRPWIAIPGVFEAEVKDVPTALRSIRRLRAIEEGRYRVLRFSPLPLSAAERALLTPDRYLHAVPPRAIASALRRCDLLLFPSRPEEGFGLPLLEAMANGVPAIASRIPSAGFITQGALPLVPPGDDASFAEAARDLLQDARRWRDARERGLDAARRFDGARVLPELLAAVRWAAAAAAGAAGAAGVPGAAGAGGAAGAAGAGGAGGAAGAAGVAGAAGAVDADAADEEPHARSTT